VKGMAEMKTWLILNWIRIISAFAVGLAVGAWTINYIQDGKEERILKLLDFHPRAETVEEMSRTLPEDSIPISDWGSIRENPIIVVSDDGVRWKLLTTDLYRKTVRIDTVGWNVQVWETGWRWAQSLKPWGLECLLLHSDSIPRLVPALDTIEGYEVVEP